MANTRPAPWLTAAQVAAMLGTTSQTVYRLAQMGQLPASLIGTRYKFRPADVEDYLDRAQLGYRVDAP